MTPELYRQLLATTTGALLLTAVLQVWGRSLLRSIALLAVQGALPRFRHEANLTTWLYRITRRVVTRWRRKERVRRWLFGGGDDSTDAPSADASPSDVLERRQASVALYRALDTLNEKHRTALLLFELEQLPAEEIAQIMQTRPGTVWVWVHRAREKLKQEVRDE